MYGLINGQTINGSGSPVCVATGFSSTAFGAPRAKVTCHANGFDLTLLGAHEATQQSPAVSLGLVVSFGLAAVPAPVTADATGWIVTDLGRPIAGTFTPAIVNRSLSASGAVMTTFGAATTDSPVITATAGALLTLLGAPTLAFGQQATSAGPTVSFGAANVKMTGRAIGTKFTLLGTPTSARVQTATSAYRATRWGTASIERSDTYLARGLYSPVRFAQPTALRLNAFAASGTTSTQFGTPVCYQRYRALHTAPACRFGKPLMRWGTPC